MAVKKILNDPVYGFISISSELILKTLDHPYFQRLRRIKQLGISDYIYPGALHTRFHHAIGAMHLMGEALKSLQEKGTQITPEEFEASQLAILLHDIGHGPFSHALEHSLLEKVSHEAISLAIMKKLNNEFKGELALVVKIFTNNYEKKFLHQLVSSQLDIDRMDYLQRDCYFTGVSEGTIGSERIIKMLDVVDNKLVVEEKGIYSIENFLNARRLMYWQVYLHKTAISAEKMLVQLFNRAKKIAKQGTNLPVSPALNFFLTTNVGLKELNENAIVLEKFNQIDDYDVWGAIKNFTTCSDIVLSNLSTALLNRNLNKVILSSEKPDQKTIDLIQSKLIKQYNVSEEDAKSFYSVGSISNAAYIAKGETINIITKKGEILDVAEASELPNIKAISQIVTKHYLSWPKNIKI